MFLGTLHFGETLTFYRQTSNRSSGAAADADSPPTYRAYEEQTAAPIATGTMALLDDINTTGYYSAQLAITREAGFAKGKSYGIRIADSVDSVAGAIVDHFRVAGSGGPIEHTPVPASRTLLVKSRADGTFGVVGRVRLVPGETQWWALELAGTQLAAGDLVDSVAPPIASGAEAANLTLPDYGVFGTLVKFECALDAAALASDEINVELEIAPSAAESLLVTVPVTVGGANGS